MRTLADHNLLTRSRVVSRRLTLPALLVVCLLASSALHVLAEDEFAEEVRLGKEAAEQVAKESKFIEEPELVERVETIGKAIAKLAVEKEVPASYGKSTLAKFDYTFKVIDDKDVNAFSLPGGFVYVNKGLIDYVHSDDELAGVIAHEIVHVSHHHAVHLLRTQQKQMLGVAAAVLAGAAVGASGSDLLKVADMASLISMARLSSYGQKAEIDSDRTAVAYLVGTEYNPVGMLTFMERLARDELRKPQVNYTIFATHPPSYQRAREIIGELEGRGIPINRRLVTTYTRVYVKPVENSQAYSVWIADTEIVRLADSGGDRAAARAERIAEKLSTILLAGARVHDVKVEGGGRYVVLMNEILITPTTDDAEMAGASTSEIVKSAAKVIRKALMKELLEAGY